MEGKKIFVLGAGASIGNSGGAFPDIKKFFTKARDLELEGSEQFERISNYAKEVFGKNISLSMADIDVEMFFTHLEIDIEKKASPEFFQLRRDFLFIIQNILVKLGIKINRSDGDYSSLLNVLKKSDTIITFNWDVTLDDILGRKEILSPCQRTNNTFQSHSKHYENFVYELSALGEHTMGGLCYREPYKIWEGEKGFLLKAHGSIDWLYCSNESCRAFRKVFPVHGPSDIHYCFECHEQVDYLLIPPILNKLYRQYPLIRKIWNLAEREISIAREIIVWGYSLPPTDFYASWLLRQGRSSFLKSLSIINPSVVSKKSKNIAFSPSFVRRFYDIFRDIIAKDSIYLYENFQDYIEGKEIFKKYDIGEKSYKLKRLQ